jgi:hypothetical protein
VPGSERLLDQLPPDAARAACDEDLHSL